MLLVYFWYSEYVTEQGARLERALQVLMLLKRERIVGGVGSIHVPTEAEVPGTPVEQPLPIWGTQRGSGL